MRRHLVLALLAIGTTAGAPIFGAVETGAAAPPMALELGLQGCSGEKIDGSAWNGKVVVLDFWATWCAPCVQEIPHWNQVVDELGGGDFVFVSITDEAQETVRRFLTAIEMRGCVALDTDRSAFEAYAIRARPTSVIIDRQGVVGFIGPTSALSASLLRKIAAGEMADFPDFDNLLALPEIEADALFEAVIRPNTTGQFAVSSSPEKFECSANPLEALLAYALQTSQSRIIFEEPFPSFYYDARVYLGKGGDWRRALLSTIESAFDLTVTRETREVPAWIITEGRPPGKPVTSGSHYMRTDTGGLSGIGDLDDVAGGLEGLFGRPVLNETGDSAIYEWNVEWESADLDALKMALAKKGITIEEGLRPVPLVIVRHRK